MDKYDAEIARLLAHANDEASFRNEVARSWNRGMLLFAVAGDASCGCLTQIRRTAGLAADKRYHAATVSLTEAIRKDPRLPIGPEAITRESLPVFAEWQRRVDREVAR